jgi:hypothetical protein
MIDQLPRGYTLKQAADLLTELGYAISPYSLRKEIADGRLGYCQMRLRARIIVTDRHLQEYIQRCQQHTESVDTGSAGGRTHPTGAPPGPIAGSPDALRSALEIFGPPKSSSRDSSRPEKPHAADGPKPNP